MGGAARDLRGAVHGDRRAGVRTTVGGSMNPGGDVTTRDRLLDPRVARALGWASLVSLVVLALFGLWGAPEDATQKEAQRLMYLHVPSAWLAYLAFGVTALASALFLW